MLLASCAARKVGAHASVAKTSARHQDLDVKTIVIVATIFALVFIVLTLLGAR